MISDERCLPPPNSSSLFALVIHPRVRRPFLPSHETLAPRPVLPASMKTLVVALVAVVLLMVAGFFIFSTRSERAGVPVTTGMAADTLPDQTTAAQGAGDVFRSERDGAAASRGTGAGESPNQTRAAQSAEYMPAASKSPQASDGPPQHIDVGSLPKQATMVDDVVVPVPSEVFSALDKMGAQNWHGAMRQTGKDPIGERAQIALQLGTVIAEGFVAVEAQDSREVKEIGRGVLSLSKAIGVEKSVQTRATSIIESADAKDWQRTRLELDGALADVKRAMIELQDEQLAQLVSLGGWLRGTEALTEIVSKNFSQDGAELLHQPTLVEYFSRRLDGLNARLKTNALVQKITARLPEIRPLIGEASGAKITAEDVKKINEITADLVKSIGTKSE